MDSKRLAFSKFNSLLYSSLWRIKHPESRINVEKTDIKAITDNLLARLKDLFPEKLFANSYKEVLTLSNGVATDILYRNGYSSNPSNFTLRYCGTYSILEMEDQSNDPIVVTITIIPEYYGSDSDDYDTFREFKVEVADNKTQVVENTYDNSSSTLVTLHDELNRLEDILEDLSKLRIKEINRLGGLNQTTTYTYSDHTNTESK